MKIAVAGLGYVGLSNAVLLAQRNEVVTLDISADRVAQVNARTSPIIDADIARYLAEVPLELRATLEPADAYAGAEFVIVSTPTDYDPVSDRFDTSSVEAVVGECPLPCSWKWKQSPPNPLFIERDLPLLRRAAGGQLENGQTSVRSAVLSA